MNKGELIKAMAEKAGFTNKDAATAYDAFVASVTEALKAGEKVQLVGFGTFEVKNVAAKTGINPQTGAKVEIAACKKPVMKFGKAYKEEINK
ncbi:MAG: HU family DNA-binding protein [Clostridia bacterium]|jgi:DNA-binding protein HU-beta|nr:HU family DNA-binding protein [Clostridia bacterium]